MTGSLNLAANSATAAVPIGRDSPWRKLEILAWLLIAIATIAAPTLFWLDFIALRESEERQVEQQTRNLAAAYELQVRSILRRVDNSMTELRDLSSRNDPRLREVARRILDVGLGLVVSRFDLITPDGRVANLAGSGVAIPGLPGDPRDAPFYRHHAETNFDRLEISWPVLPPGGSEPLLHFSRRLSRPDGSLQGVLVATARTEYFERLFSALELPGDGSLTMIGTDGYFRVWYSAILGTTDVIGRRVDPDRPFLIPNAAVSGNYRGIGSVTRTERIFGYRLVTDYPAVVNVGLPLTAAHQVARNAAVSDFIVGGGLLAVVYGIGGSMILLVRRKQRDDALFSDIVENVPGVAYQYVIAPNGAAAFTWVSSNAETQLGVSADDLLTNQFRFRVLPEDLPRFRHSMSGAARTGERLHFTGRYIGVDGAIHHFRTVANVDRQPDGTAMLNGVIFDTTAEETSLRRIETTEGRLSTLLDSALDGIVMLDANRRITSFNKGAERMFGRTATEMIGEPLDILLPDAARISHDKHLQIMLAGPDGARAMGDWRRVQGRHADGHVFPMLASVAKVTVGGTPILSAIMRDMSDTAATEESLESFAHEQGVLLERATQASEAKSKFLAVMSHELRTPLNAIIGFSEMMAGEVYGPLGAERYRGYVRDIQASGRHLLGIINDILDLTKITESGVDLNPVALDANDVLDDATLLVSELAARKHVCFAVHVADGLAPVRADQRALHQVMLNLLANAIKYAPEQSVIHASARPGAGPDAIDFVIEDEGPGVPEDMLPHLGEPFTQVRSTYAADNSGTGLGLAIVRQLVNAHRGSLAFANRPEGGLRVTVTLPAAVSIRKPAARQDRQLADRA